MKSLRNILEGIFDIEDNIANDQHLDELLFKDPDSEFWKFINIKYIYASRLLNYGDASIDIDKDLITINDNNINVELRTNKNPLSIPYDLKVSWGICIGDSKGSGPHPDKIINNAGFKSLTARRFWIDGMCGEIKDCKFDIINENYLRHMSDGFVCVYWGDQLKFNNVEFNFEEGTTAAVIKFDNLVGFPNLNGLKSNAKKLTLYSPSFFDYDDAKKKLEKFFGKGTFETFYGGTKNKTIRNIIAAANNPTKYGGIKPLTIAPEGTVEELFGTLKGLKNLEEINLSNNNVEIKFMKTLPKNWVKFLQVTSQGARKFSTQELTDMFKKTNDGWYMTVQKKYLA